MSRKSRPSHLTSIVNDLLAGIASTDEERRDISCLGTLGHGLMEYVADLVDSSQVHRP